MSSESDLGNCQLKLEKWISFVLILSDAFSFFFSFL